MHPGSPCYRPQRARAAIRIYHRSFQKAFPRALVPCIWRMLYCCGSFYYFLGRTSVRKEDHDVVHHSLLPYWRHQCQLYAGPWFMYCHQYSRTKSGEASRLFNTTEILTIRKFKNWFIYFLLAFVACTLCASLTQLTRKGELMIFQ